jgi:Secretion system C-terminal sorting domain
MFQYVYASVLFDKIYNHPNMLNLKSVLISVAIGFITKGLLYSQSSMNAGGISFSGADGSISFSCGQILFHTFQDLDFYVAEGVQQPFEISVVNGMAEPTEEKFVLLAYPNPVANEMLLEIQYISFSNLKFVIFDASGNRVLQQKISQNITLINMGQFAAGAYYIQVIYNQKILKNFKLIKP